MDDLDALIAASAQRVLGPPPAPPAAPADPLDALIARSTQAVLGDGGAGPDFSGVQSSTSSTAQVTGLPDQAAPPAPAGLDAAFRQWYQNYVKQTGAALSYDQARQLYKSLPPEERSAKPAPPSTGEIIERVQNAWGMPSPAQAVEAAKLYGRNVLSGMKGGADFLAHVPDMAVQAVAAVPAALATAAEEGQRPRRLLAASGSDEAFSSELQRQGANPIQQAQPSQILPRVIEDTFQSSRDERERLAEETTKKLTEAGASPGPAAAAYAVPQTVGNLLDPTMLLAPAEIGKLGRGLDGLIVRSTERVLGKKAAEATAARVAEDASLRELQQVSLDTADQAMARLETPATEPAGPAVADAMAHAGSDVSPEAINRVARREQYVRVTPGGDIVPIINDVGAVDVRVNPGEVKAVLAPDGALRVEQGRPNAAQARALESLRAEGGRAEPGLPEPEAAAGPIEIDAPEMDDELRALMGLDDQRGVPDATQAPGPSGQASPDPALAPALPDAEQGGRPSAVAGRQEGEVGPPPDVVEVAGRRFELTPEGRAAWDEADRQHARAVEFAKRNIDRPDQIPGNLKAAGMKLSAERRRIVGALTAKEQKAADRLYFGRPVEVDGRPGKISGNAFGKIKVKFEDGAEQVVPRESIAPAKESNLAREILPETEEPNAGYRGPEDPLGSRAERPGLPDRGQPGQPPGGPGPLAEGDRPGAAAGPADPLTEIARHLPEAGAVVDGRAVRAEIPNLHSIDSSLDSFEELPGVREVPMDHFDPEYKPSPYSKSERERLDDLKRQIQASREINPLIVVYDKQAHPYILEGGHRFDALHEMGAKSFPAKVVIDTETLAPKELAARLRERAVPAEPVPSRALNEAEPAAAEPLPAPRPTTAEAIEPGSTGIKNAVVEAERPLRGLPPEVDHEGRRAVGEAWDAAKAEIETDPARPRRLAEELKASKRPHTAEESAILTIGRQQLYDERKTAVEAAGNALKAGDEEGLASAKARLASIDADLEVNDMASSRSGYEWGLAGRLRQMMVREDYSTYRVLQKARVAAEAPELPKAVEERLTAFSSRIEETSKALEAARGQLDELKARRAVKAMEREAAYEARTARRQAVKQDLDAEFSALSSEFGKKAATPRTGIDPELAKLIAKMAKNRVKAGVTTVEQLVDTIYQVARTHMPEITPRQVRDAISGYGADAKASKRQTTSALADVNRQLRLLSSLEDAKAGKAPAKRAGGPAPKPSPRVKELERQLREEMRRQGLDSQARLSAYEGRLKSRKAELERRLAEKDFAKPGPRAPVNSPETLKLQVDLERLKGQIDSEVKKLEMANRSPFEKGLDIFVKWRRAVLLSSAATMEKLGAAAGLRAFVTTPIEQLIGGAYAKVPGLSAIAAKAPREGAMDLAAEAKAFATVFSKETYKDAWQAVKTGKTSLDVLYGKKGDFPPEVLDFFGHLHAGMKTLPKKAEFKRSLELRYAFARKRGWDLTSPAIQAEIAAQAYADAQRAILLQDNVFTDGYRIALNFLKGKNAKGTAAVLETLFPIIKVPTNYVSEALEYGLGPARALNKLIWSGGIQGLDAHGADYVMRNLKKGTVGSALLALGYYNADKIGGYYQRNEKRDPEDVHVSDVRMNLFGRDFDIPHQLLHAPALEMLQMGATLRRVKERYEERGKDHGTAAGIQAAERGLAEQVPFYEELMSVGRANESPASWQKYAGNLGRSMVLPPDLQNFARVHDQEEVPGFWKGTAQMFKLSHPETVKRYPENLFFDEFKVGIPWVRESVPDSK